MTCSGGLPRQVACKERFPLSPRVANAEKRFRISLLLDAYGELLTEKQRDFLRRYYEEDFSFGEIAREAGVSRQAVFDSVKHGEAALENYERVLGLVGEGEDAAVGRSGGRRQATAGRAEAAADRLRRWIAESNLAGADAEALAELEDLAGELESLAADLRGTQGGLAAGSGGPANAESRGSLVLRDGPEVD